MRAYLGRGAAKRNYRSLGIAGSYTSADDISFLFNFDIVRLSLLLGRAQD